MKEQNKYFTPDIEDIRVGYECELLWNQNMLPEDSWDIIKVWEDGTNEFDIIDWIGKIANSKLRTPYLTKEQIEAEVKNGFTIKNLEGTHHLSHECVILIKGNNWLILKKYKEIDPIYMLTVLPIDPVKEAVDIDCHFPKYHGECKSINEFRTTCKLLKIK